MDRNSFAGTWGREFEASWGRALHGGLFALAGLLLLALVLLVLLTVLTSGNLLDNLFLCSAYWPIGGLTAVGGMLAAAAGEGLLKRLRQCVAVSWCITYFASMIGLIVGFLGAMLFALAWVVIAIAVAAFSAAFGTSRDSFSLSSIVIAACVGGVLGSLFGFCVGLKKILEDLRYHYWNSGKVMEQIFSRGYRPSGAPAIPFAIFWIMSGAALATLPTTCVIGIFIVLSALTYCLAAGLCAAGVTTLKCSIRWPRAT
jgi:hypothetical protein